MILKSLNSVNQHVSKQREFWELSNPGLFVPGSKKSTERTFVLWNICSRGARSPRTFVPWNFRNPGTFTPQERMFHELSLHKQFSCPLTFAPVELLLPYLKSCGKQESNVSIGIFWQTFAAVYLSGNDVM